MVAFLVDRTDFLNDLQTSREELNLKTLISHDKVSSWEEEELQLLKKTKPPTVINTGNGIAYWDPNTPLELITFKLLKKYKKPPTYYDVVSKAILSGCVTDDDFTHTAYCYVDYPDFYNPKDYGLNIIEEPKICIVITPDTKLNEVVELFKTEVGAVVEQYNRHLNTHKNKFEDTISNIKRDRKWYWQHNEELLSYSKIQLLSKKDGHIITADGVSKAINQYRQRLTLELY